MDCLELDIRQQILSDLATLKSGTPDDLLSTQQLIQSKAQLSTSDESLSNGEIRTLDATPRIFMSEARAQCSIAFGELVVNFTEEHIHNQVDTLTTALVESLHDAPQVDYDQCLSWDEWALPDQLVYSTVSALLRICSTHEDRVDQAINVILGFIAQLVEGLKTASSLEVLTQLTPSLHGLYRAITSALFPWTTTQWRLISQALDGLVQDSVLERINRLLLDIHQEAGGDLETPDTFLFCHTFISRYIAHGRPLSGYFIVCCIMEMQWTILAQTLAAVPVEGVKYGAPLKEAAAANKAWLSLMHKAAQKLNIQDGETKDVLLSTIEGSLQCFNDLLAQIQDMETELPIDTYVLETMSESLKLASICSVALGELDSDLYARLGLLLSDSAPIMDNLVQEAALKAMTVLVQNFPEIAKELVNHLRCFVTSPLSIFEFAFNTEKRAPPPLTAAAKCFGLCIKLAPGEDSVMSNMYSLLNYIAATSKEIFESSSQQLLKNPLYTSALSSSTDYLTFQSEEAGLRDRSDEEKRLIGITTISIVTRLALEFDNQEVTKLTISMLLQRLRTAEPTVEAAIAYNLVDLALVAREDAFVDIIRAFSSINHAANPEDPRFSNNMVLAAQTRLAREMGRRSDLYDVYLAELLALFSDKGVAIQDAAVSERHGKTEEMMEQLASLLLPIEALLDHADFSPHLNTELMIPFRNMWFLCILFHFTASGEEKEREKSAMTWLLPALGRIALKTPCFVLESVPDAPSDMEYRTVVRREYAHSVLAKHRACLTRHIPLRTSEIRSMTTGQVIFMLTMHDIETMRSAAGLPSSLVSYFINTSLNKHTALNACMEAVAEKVIRGCISDLNTQAAEQALPNHLSTELCNLLVSSTHRTARARDVASKYLNRLITSFPSLMCDPKLVYAILECLTLLRRACENEYTDEYNPIFEFHSERTGVNLQLTDDYRVRNEVLGQLQRNANNWFELALSRAPIEFQSTLQKYLAATQSLTGSDAAELGASVAEKFAKAFGPVHRQLTSLRSLSNLESDRARVLASQLASKSYFAGEVAGLRLANYKAQVISDKVPPQNAPSADIPALKEKMADTMNAIRGKTSPLTIQDLKRLLFRCAATLISLEKCEYSLVHYLVTLPFEVFTPAAIAAGIEVWTWVIAEKPVVEVALMCEVLSAWFGTVRDRKGVFSQTLNYDDPFYHPIGYSPTDKEEIDRATSHARRLLVPHTLVLQMLFSRLQAARYRRSTVMFLIQRLVLRSAHAHKLFSTHPLARELRYSFLLFGFETLKSSHLDIFSECTMRDSLYRTAFAWFADRPQWSFGANRVQLDADVKVLSEFLGHLQTDTVRCLVSLSSLSPTQTTAKNSPYISRLKSINHPLRLLVENEIYRLTVWANPSNDARRGHDHHGTVEQSMLENNWPTVVRTVWEVDPAIAVHMMERFKSPAAHAEVQRLVRTNPTNVAHVPEGLRYLIDDSTRVPKRDLKHILVWAPVPPVIAVTFFEKKHNNDPYLLQYAHRVLKQHPVDLTFFFVPQVVQALRFDDLGYIARFILETAKISQLFCHQIVWNMKANCYKDDAAEIEDPMKPALDRMTDLVVESLSGETRSFYDREFKFFHEVTSISGKLKPYIKKTKPEKKTKIDEEMAKIRVDVGVYLPSNPDGKVVDIDKLSGRPLQSHAKAPFMATFKVRKERVVVETDPEALLDASDVEKREEYDVWQQAIFKVGDDCRQDVLALQVIAMFKNIFTSIGLTLYLYPYRVTATAPGCGVIDVVPNATSRDEMGRAKVNDLLDFFISKYEGEETVAFQRARLNFIQSMAAYSVACYILQIKDRHNGNIMIDGEGHIVHIDFGFLFDIGPGGVKFEPSSFKLNHEMVVLMGGRYSQGYELFQQLTVKAFLALRPHADQLVSTVQLMLGTGLPSFKGESTIKRLKDRFALGLNERQAAEWMMGIIRNAHENVRSTAYDEFQRLQNGIPY
ncbi:1-phosphatidylinositol 4-kinase, partial [Paxillus involutus ATCC 200175]